MRINYTDYSFGKNSQRESYCVSSFVRSHFSRIDCGTIEEFQEDELKNVKTILANLVEFLVEKKLMNAEELTTVLDSDYKNVEIVED